jgi:hypothetical protein
MTIGTVRTQGTELFFIDTVTDSNSTVRKMACPTGITGGTGAKDQIEDTCLDNTEDKTFKAGLGNPGARSVPFNFIPSNFSHQTLLELKRTGENVKWFVGLSDGTAVPTIDDDLNWIPPAAPLRTSYEFEGYVSDVAIDIATNEIVRGTLSIQVSGSDTWHWNGPTPTA